MARHGLRRQYGDGWGCAAAQGPTKSGKTGVGVLVARLLGLDPAVAVRLVPHDTPGELFARRTPTAGGGWRMEPSPVTTLPFAVLDEWDKGSSEVRQAAAVLLLGRTREVHEGCEIEMRPHVLCTLNPGGARTLAEAVRRRAVLLDTAALRPLLRDVDEALRRAAAVPMPVLALDALAVRPLPDEARADLRRRLREAMTDDGWALADVEPLARVAAGRAALGMEPGAAAAAVATDFLLVAATWGGVREDALRPDERALLRARAQQVETRRAAEALELEARRGECVAECSDAAAALPRTRGAAGLRRALLTAARRLRAAPDAAHLEAILTAAQPHLERARAMAEAEVQRRQQERDRREAEAAAAKARRDDARRALADARMRREALGRLARASAETMWRACRDWGLVRWRELPAAGATAALGGTGMDGYMAEVARATRVGSPARTSFLEALGLIVGAPPPPRGRWEDANGREVDVDDAAAILQGVYDAVDRHVVALGGAPRPRRFAPRAPQQARPRAMPAPRKPKPVRPTARHHASPRRRRSARPAAGPSRAPNR